MSQTVRSDYFLKIKRVDTEHFGYTNFDHMELIMCKFKVRKVRTSIFLAFCVLNNTGENPCKLNLLIAL